MRGALQKMRARRPGRDPNLPPSSHHGGLLHLRRKASLLAFRGDSWAASPVVRRGKEVPAREQFARLPHRRLRPPRKPLDIGLTSGMPRGATGETRKRSDAPGLGSGHAASEVIGAGHSAMCRSAIHPPSFRLPGAESAGPNPSLRRGLRGILLPALPAADEGRANAHGVLRNESA